MSIRDDGSQAYLSLVEKPDESWFLPQAPPDAEPDRQSLHDRTQARAAAAEARVQELLNDIRRLRTALRKAEAGNGTSKPLPTTTGRLHKALEKSRRDKDTIQSLRTEVGGLRREVRRLRRDLQWSETHKETIRRLSKEGIRLRADLRGWRDQQDAIRRQSSEIYRLEVALEVSESRKGALKAKLAKLLAARTTLSRPIAGPQLRAALRRSWHQKRTITSLSEENRRLRRAVRASEALKTQAAKHRAARETLSKALSGRTTELRVALRRSRRQKKTITSLSKGMGRLRKALRSSEAQNEALEAKLAKLRATGAVLSKALYGRKSEQQKKPPSERKRGQQRGAAGHGRTPRPALEERTEPHDPPADERACRRCGEPYVGNGSRVSTIFEIDVKAHKRVIDRSRWRRTCTCASSPRDVSSPPLPRLFPNTAYGTSVWSRFLYERYGCFRPLNRISAWMSDQGLPIAAGTLANSVPRFLPLFEPLHDAILEHQNRATVRHGDETTWRVQALREKDRSSRAWLWTSVSADAVYFHIDPSRSAEAAETLFAGAAHHTVLVCDRYSAYKKLARIRRGVVTLAWCWAHQRRDFINCAAGHTQRVDWCQEWIERIAAIYRLNEARLAHYDPGLEHRSPAFDAAQGALKEAVDGLFAHAERELAELPDGAHEGKPLRSLVNHRGGLCVFVDKPQVPLDNNAAERALRGPVIGRQLSFGSDSERGALFTARMYSIVGTLKMNGIDVLRWLEEWLGACAANGGRPPEDLSPWLPWSMSEERRRDLSIAPG